MSKISENYDKNKPSLGITPKMAEKSDVVNRLSQRNNLYVTDKGSSNTDTDTSSSSSSYTSSSMVPEQTEIDAAPKPPEAIIQPQDNSTIKYLSNVKDPDSGKVSKPFVIGGKNYQMIRGLLPNKTIVMGVYSFDDLDSKGKNIIHSVEDFEKNIAEPVKRLEEEQFQAQKAEQDKQLQAKAIEDAKQSKEPEASEEVTYEGSKHFLVNRENGNVRNFKNIKELLSQEKLDEEDYMGVQEFKQHINKKLFGGRKKTEAVGEQHGMLNEVTPTGQETDEEMNIKAKKLMEMIKKRIPEIIIKSIKTPVAKREVIAAFAEMIGVPRNGLANLLTGLKDLAKLPIDQKGQQAQQQGQQVQPQPAQPIQENKKVMTKNDLINSLKVTKIIKVKDIK